MKAKLKELAPCQKELRVEVPREAVEAEFEAVYREMKRVASVPGFRVGHAPRDLLERYHGARARETVLKRLLGRSLEEALQAQGRLDLVRRPQVAEIQLAPKEPMTYLARLEIAPEVPLGRYRGLRLTRPKAAVSEERLSEVLTHLQQTHAQLKLVLEPRAAAPHDFLLADLTEKPPNQPPKKQRDVIIHLDLEKDPQGLLKELVGMTPGQKRSVTLNGGTAVTVELKGLKVKEILPLDDAFARNVGPFESLEALRQVIRRDLNTQAEASQRQGLQAQVFQQLLEGWNFDVPPSLVGSQAQRLLKERAMELMSQGVASSQVQEQAQVLTDQAKLEALKDVKIFFILRRIASAEGMSATEAEVEDRIKALAERLRTPVDEMRRDLESKGLLEELAWSIIRAKVVDLLVREAEIA